MRVEHTCFNTHMIVMVLILTMTSNAILNMIIDHDGSDRDDITMMMLMKTSDDITNMILMMVMMTQQLHLNGEAQKEMCVPQKLQPPNW